MAGFSQLVASQEAKRLNQSEGEHVMKIVLNEKHSIVTDEYNYMLQRKRMTGNKHDNLGNFPNLSNLIHYLLNYEILTSKAESFIEIKQLVERVRDEIVTNLNKHNIKLER